MQPILVNFTKNEDPPVAKGSLYRRCTPGCLADNMCKILGQPWKTEMRDSLMNCCLAVVWAMYGYRRMSTLGMPRKGQQEVSAANEVPLGTPLESLPNERSTTIFVSCICGEFSSGRASDQLVDSCEMALSTSLLFHCSDVLFWVIDPRFCEIKDKPSPK